MHFQENNCTAEQSKTELAENNEKSFQLIIHSSLEKYLAAKYLHKISAGAIYSVLFELRILIYVNFEINK